MKNLTLLGALAATLIATPALADRVYRGPIFSENNPYWRDYQTDLSEARRELRSDLRRARTAQDRAEAQREYRHEVADARRDFVKEMREKGRLLGRGRVSVGY